MPQRKIFQLLASLSSKELKEFRLFLASPLCNKSDTLKHLFDLIRPFHPNFTHVKLKDEQLFEKLTRERSFSRKYLTDRLHELSVLLEDFLAIQYIRTNHEEKRRALRKALIQHKQFKLFQKENQKRIENLEASSANSWQKNLELWELHYEIYTHPETHKFTEKKDEATDMMEYLDEAYIILKLRYGFHKKWRFKIFEDTHEDSLLQSLIENSKKNKNPTIQIYLLLFEYFDSRDKTSIWEQTLLVYKKQFEHLPREEKLAILIFLINIGYKLATSKKPSFFNRMLELYQFGLNNNLLVHHGRLSEHTFKNIVITGSSIKAFKWTKSFIQTYEQYLPESVKGNTLFLAQAYLAFYQGDFQKAFDLLQSPPEPRIGDKIQFKSLQVRCLYELQTRDHSFQETLLSALSSFSVFLQRAKNLSEERKTAYKNFIHMVHQLCLEQGKISIKKQSHQKLNLTLEKRKNIIARSWIKEKIDQI